MGAIYIRITHACTPMQMHNMHTPTHTHAYTSTHIHTHTQARTDTFTYTLAHLNAHKHRHAHKKRNLVPTEHCTFKGDIPRTIHTIMATPTQKSKEIRSYQKEKCNSHTNALEMC